MATPSAFVNKLVDVPEVMLAEPLANAPQQAFHNQRAIAMDIDDINTLNRKDPDGFLTLLLAERTDLVGLPFQMGDECRLSSARSERFNEAATMVHKAQSAQPRSPRAVEPQNGNVDVQNGSAFFANLMKLCADSDDTSTPSRLQEYWDHVVPARLAAMTQICGPMSDSMKMALAKYLAAVSSVDSTRELVKLVLFSPEQSVSDMAILALKARREADVDDALLQGLRYPWPEVATRAAEGLAKLKRKDLVPRIIEVLDEVDPRAPVMEPKNGKSELTVRELVRINHHRNCLMCHATAKNAPRSVRAEVPVPGQPLPALTEGGYGSREMPEMSVRIDVTYLRQDFSTMLPVANAEPWPEMQRFDFVVRERTLKDDEVKAYKQKFDNVQPPNHRAALFALRELTGKDAAPTADAWRKMMNVSK
jgi:hypothetical protein